MTGQRKSEVAGMAWSELDRSSAIWTIPAERAKNKNPHLVPLSAPVTAELDVLADGQQWPKTGYVLTTTGRTPISGFSKAKLMLDQKITDVGEGAALPPWRVHDLRRTAATGLQRLGVRFEVTEAVLNHVSGAKGGIAGVYQRHDWALEKRLALEAWAGHVDRLLTGKIDTNVVRMEARS
jgi:integrase